MEKEYVLKLHQHEIALIVEALESEMANAKRMIPSNGKEQDTLNFIQQSISEILDKIQNKMVCIN